VVFSSAAFFIFFACLLVVSALVKNRKARHIILLISSYVFYGWWDWRFCFLMFFITVTSYISALQIEKNNSKKIFVIGIVIPLVVLGIFKYYNFFLSSFCGIFGIENPGAFTIILPVGISFYTFQALSYVVDVRRKKIAAVRSFPKLALYISFFPQLVAGPIVRAGHFLPQLEEDRNVSRHNFATGSQIFLFGLAKKIVFADRLSVFVDGVFRTPAAYHGLSIILAVIAYSIQIYFDFSGYSDMAIGSAKCLGYDFLPNFNLPYLSKNVGEFWKRWHISLSTFLKDYLYIPLGGNRRGTARVYLNNMLTMLLGGLWHGANWTFVVWGALHGLALLLHRIYRKITPLRGKKARGKFFSRAGAVFSILLTNVFICLCWIFFRADSFDTAWVILYRIVTFKDGIIQPYTWFFIALGVVIIASGVALIKKRKDNTKEASGFYPILNLKKAPHLLVFFLVILFIAGLAYTGANPFIYFQF
jgi:alginate O-acetyltransferase complex protein AlgI